MSFWNTVLRAFRCFLRLVAALVVVVPIAMSQSKSSKTAIAYYNRGNESYQKREYSRAIADFTFAITFDPGFVWAYNNRGNARLEVRDVEGAIDDFSRALELDPRFASAYANRGRARDARGDHSGALEDLYHAAELDPRGPIIFFNRAGVWKTMG